MNYTIEKNKTTLYAKLLAIYFCLMPFDIFSIFGSGTLLKYYAIILVTIPILLLISKNAAINYDEIFLSIAVFIVLCGLSMFYSIDSASSRTQFISLFLNFGLIICCGIIKYSEDDIKLLQRALIIGGLLTILLTLIFNDFSWDGRLTLSIFDDTADQNFINGYLLFALGFAINAALYKAKNLKFKVLMGLLCFIVIVFTLATGSRGALFAEASIFFVSFIIFIIRSENKKRNLTLFFGISACVLLLFFVALLILPDEISVRFSLSYISKNGTTSRTKIWESLLARFFSDDVINMFFGHGLGASKTYNLYNDNVAHNSFLEVLIGTGFVGLASYIAMHIAILWKAWKSKNDAAFAIFIGFIVMGMSLSLVVYKPILNVILYIYIYSMTFENKEKKLKKVPLKRK